MTYNLKPCPHCGDEVDFTMTRISISGRFNANFYCQTCEALTQFAGMRYPLEAIRAWNKREPSAMYNKWREEQKQT